jgi:hypothetical protein
MGDPMMPAVLYALIFLQNGNFTIVPGYKTMTECTSDFEKHSDAVGGFCSAYLPGFAGHTIVVRFRQSGQFTMNPFPVDHPETCGRMLEAINPAMADAACITIVPLNKTNCAS